MALFQTLRETFSIDVMQLKRYGNGGISTSRISGPANRKLCVATNKYHVHSLCKTISLLNDCSAFIVYFGGGGW